MFYRDDILIYELPNVSIKYIKNEYQNKIPTINISNMQDLKGEEFW